MGIFSRNKDKASNASSSRSNSANIADLRSSASSQSSLKSPGLAKMASTPVPTIPKVDLPKPPKPEVDPAGYLRSIDAVRERCAVVKEKAVRNKLNHFDVDMSKFKDAASFVVSIIKRDFSPDYSEIPPHGRWQHFNVGGKDRIGAMMSSWPSATDPPEQCRRLLDLFLVSVLMDAGAGTTWQYKSRENGRIYKRSEGLAVASLEMFQSGLFSSDRNQPHQVNGAALKRLTVEDMIAGLQVSPQNPIPGLEGRTGLLVRLGEALNNETFFGSDARPGNMLDYLLTHPSTQASSVPIVVIPTLWSVIMDGLGPIWPSTRTQIDGVSLGDAWPLSTMPSGPTTQPWENIVPFHKLSQWLCYSLMQPMTKLVNIHFAGAELLTGLPEYRNGGLFIDTGVLTLRAAEAERGLQNFHDNAEKEGKKGLEVVPTFSPDDDVVVEWRAATVGFLDMLLEEVNNSLGLFGMDRLTLPQMLEAGSWKGGRELAEVSRPNTKVPPIQIMSDGTVF